MSLSPVTTVKCPDFTQGKTLAGHLAMPALGFAGRSRRCRFRAGLCAAATLVALRRSIHKETYTFSIGRGEKPRQHLLGGSHVRSPGHVNQGDLGVGYRGKGLWKILNMKVPPGAGTLDVVPIEKRAFDQHGTAVANEIQIQKPTERRITRVGDERNLDRVFNRHTAFLQRHQFGAGLAVELGFQLVSCFYQRIAQRAGRMVDLERAHQEPPSQGHVLERLDADYF